MPTDAERIAKLEQEVAKLEEEMRRLQIKHETLVNFLMFSHLGPSDGRVPYDARVRQALEQAGLRE